LHDHIAKTLTTNSQSLAVLLKQWSTTKH